MEQPALLNLAVQNHVELMRLPLILSVLAMGHQATACQDRRLDRTGRNHCLGLEYLQNILVCLSRRLDTRYCHRTRSSERRF